MKRVLMCAVCVVGVLLSVAFPAAAEKYVIKIGNVTAPDHPLNVSFEKMAALMNE